MSVRSAGGIFGGRIDLYSDEYCASRLSMIAGRPVQITASREEIFSAFRHAQPLILEIKTGVNEDGTIVAQRIRAINNAGGFRGSGVVVIFFAWGFTMIYDATGVRLHSTPFSAEKILAGLRVLEYAAKKSRQGEEARA